MQKKDLQAHLDQALERFNQPNFIADDPIGIPHQLSDQRDQEIMAFFAATLAWGQRVTIINKCNELLDYFDGSPHQFITQHADADLKPLLQFKHRTFNPTDLLYFIDFLRRHYSQHKSLETAFSQFIDVHSEHVGPALIGFHDYFFDAEHAPQRTRKHVATPARKSACKRLNMFLRWMVRQDDKGVDFGIWKSIEMRQLLCPLDVHVGRVARGLGLLTRPSDDWTATLELTETLRQFDAEDPVKYDFALFGLGLEGKLSA